MKRKYGDSETKIFHLFQIFVPQDMLPFNISVRTTTLM